MNKSMVEEYIPIAYSILSDNTVICRDGKISSTLRGNIAAFGAAVQMGSLLSAVAFFSQQGGASQPRQELQESEKSLFHYICEADEAERNRAKVLVVNAAIAVKLAMNLFELEMPKKPEE